MSIIYLGTSKQISLGADVNEIHIKEINYFKSGPTKNINNEKSTNKKLRFFTIMHLI